MYLNKEQLEELLERDKLVIRPLLDKDAQLGQMSIDFRLGTDFLVSFLGREPYIDVSGKKDSKPVRSFFDSTRRKFGETFLLHPRQTVLCSTLEYVKLPDNVFGVLNMRSSYSRLGLSISTIIQAGYTGCLSMELTNINNNPIRLRVGARILQVRFFQGEKDTPYNVSARKYKCQVRPIISKAPFDKDLELLTKISEL